MVNVFESHDAEQITGESDMDDTFDGDGIPEAPDVHEMDVYTNLNEDQRSIAERCAAHLAEIPVGLHDAGLYDWQEHMAGPGIDWDMAQHDAAEQDGDSEEYLTGPDVTEGQVTEHDGNLEEGMHANAGMETDGYEVPEEFSQDTELVQDVIQALATVSKRLDHSQSCVLTVPVRSTPETRQKESSGAWRFPSQGQAKGRVQGQEGQARTNKMDPRR